MSPPGSASSRDHRSRHRAKAVFAKRTRLSQRAERTGSSAWPSFQLRRSVSPNNRLPARISFSSSGKYSSKYSSKRCSSIQVATATLTSSSALAPCVTIRFHTKRGRVATSSPAAAAEDQRRFSSAERSPSSISRTLGSSLTVPLSSANQKSSPRSGHF